MELQAQLCRTAHAAQLQMQAGDSAWAAPRAPFQGFDVVKWWKLQCQGRILLTRKDVIAVISDTYPETCSSLDIVQVLGINFTWFLSIALLSKIFQQRKVVQGIKPLSKRRRSLIVLLLSFSGRNLFTVTFIWRFYSPGVCDFPSYLIFVHFKNLGKWKRPSHFKRQTFVFN